MKRRTRRIETQLAIVGTGIAGFAAASFARRQGLDVAQFGHSGAMAHTTGYLDLLGARAGRVLHDPWEGLRVLRREEPHHPLARVGEAEIRTACTQFIAALGDMGLTYSAPQALNRMALLPFGGVKPTLCVPATMLKGIEARTAGAPALIVGFEGLPGFSAAEFAINAAGSWPGLRAVTLPFPGLSGGQIFAEVMARSLETRAARVALGELIRAHVREGEHVGLPAILGINAPGRVLGELEAMTGAHLFEIPTIPPGVPGIRLREAFERALPERGVRLEPQLKVDEVAFTSTGAVLKARGALEDIELHAQAVILATGRFLSGGLRAQRNGISEALLGLDVGAPADRGEWFRSDPFDARGHPLNRAGIVTDTALRPLSGDNRPVHARLFAAGTILAGQDWVRERSGAGLAIATAHRAVSSAAAAIARKRGGSGERC